MIPGPEMTSINDTAKDRNGLNSMESRWIYEEQP